MDACRSFPLGTREDMKTEMFLELFGQVGLGSLQGNSSEEARVKILFVHQKGGGGGSFSLFASCSVTSFGFSLKSEHWSLERSFSHLLF